MVVGFAPVSSTSGGIDWTYRRPTGIDRVPTRIRLTYGRADREGMPRTRSRLLLATFLCAFAALPATAAAAPDLFLDDANPTGAAYNDGILAPGETFNLTPSFTVGNTYFDGGNGTISAPLGSKLSTPTYLQPIPEASPSTATYPANPFVATLAPDYVCGQPTPITLAIDGANGHGEYAMNVQTGAAGPHANFVSDDIGDSIADAETVESDVTVTPNKVKSLRVHIDALSHSYSLRWYEIVLVSPKGTRVKLFNRFGEDTQKTITDVVFDDSAALEYTDNSITQYDNLSVRPAESLAAFDGEDAAGTWRLEVRDVHEAGSARSSRSKARAGVGEVVGQLDGWSLDVAGAVCARTPVAAINPAPLVLDPAGGTVIDGGESVDPGKNNAGSADGAITKYEWDLDGAGSFEVNEGTATTTTFPAAAKGKRNIRLQVTDNDGLLNVATVEALITKQPIISAAGATPASPEAGQLTTVAATASDPDGSISNYAWDFNGDGIFEVTGSSPDTAHSWDKSGPHVVRVKVTDDTGATKVKAFTVTVANKPPVANLSVNASPVIMGEAVVFDASESTDPDGEVVSYRWDLDGVPGYEETTDGTPTLPYTFNESGPHTVTVEVRDNSDIPDTETLQVLVTAAPNAVISASTAAPQPAQVVSFDGGGSTDGEPGGTITKYEWDLDGNNSYETTGKTATKSYPNVSNVQVKLRVTNAAGAKGEAFKAITVTAPPPAPTPVPTPKPTPTPTPVIGPGGGVIPVPTPDIVKAVPGLDPKAEVTNALIVDNVSDALTGTDEVADTAVSTSGFQAKLSVASKWKVKKALKGGIVVKVTANAPGKLVIKGMITAKLAKSLGLKPKGTAALAVASGKVAITKAGTYKFLVKVPKKYQRSMKKSKKSVLTLRAGVTQTATGEIVAIGKNITLVK